MGSKINLSESKKFEEVFKRTQEHAKKRGITRKDIEEAIREVRSEKAARKSNTQKTG